MPEPTTVGPVHLRLPPDPSMSRVLRLAAGGLASLAGFTIDETENLQIAVSEVLLALIEHGAGRSVDIEFELHEQSIDVRGRTAVEKFDGRQADLDLCRAVLADVCRDSSISVVDGDATIWASVAHARTG